jgi:hypothetical protein
MTGRSYYFPATVAAWADCTKPGSHCQHLAHRQMTSLPASEKRVADPMAEETDTGHGDASDLRSGGMTIKALSVPGVG